MPVPKDYTVLIVDDEDDLREAIAFDFRRRGYQVLVASGGHAAFEFIERQKVDLVLSDIHMPNGDGIELLKKIKAKAPALPTFMFIGSSMEVDLTPEDAYEAGAEGVFSKPFDRKELQEAVAYALLPLDQRFQRQSPRLRVESPTGIKFLKSNFSLESKILNLGRGGIFVALHGRFPEKGEEVEFRINVTSAPPLELAGGGIVRWIRAKGDDDFPSGCGIEFTNLNSESAAKVVELIRRAEMKTFIPRK